MNVVFDSSFDYSTNTATVAARGKAAPQQVFQMIEKDSTIAIYCCCREHRFRSSTSYANIKLMEETVYDYI